MTTAGGAGTWDPAWGALFAGRKVLIGYDSETAWTRRDARHRVAANIALDAAETYVLDLLPDRKDGLRSDRLDRLRTAPRTAPRRC